MQSQVLWTIDNEMEGSKFERLCVDLLYRNGYKDIVPIEPQDGGRDAEELPRRGRDREGCPSFFQFSLEAGWKRKIRRDAAKLGNRGAEITYLVFVTSQRVRGVDIDLLRAEFRRLYGWTLIVYSREWLRLQLEEANPDLSRKYLGIRIKTRARTPSWLTNPRSSVKSGLRAALRAIEAAAFDRAIDLLLTFVDAQPESSVAWQLLAWAHYRLERFDEALSLINRAIKLSKEPRFELVRACILAEKGIRDRSRSELRIAEGLFRAGLSGNGDLIWMVHYNLGNVLSALKKHAEAIEHYKSALKLERNRPAIWKNLGSAYHDSGDHASEMKCLDKALELDPLLPEALASKAVSFIIDQVKPQEAVPLLEAARRSEPGIVNRWPKIWYWLAIGCEQAGHLSQAYDWAEEGLNHQPGSKSLMLLKSNILAKLQQSDSIWSSKAREFWSSQLTAEPMNFEARRQLAHAEILAGNAPAAWKLVDDCLPLFAFEPDVSFQVLELDLAQCIDAIEFLPEYTRFRSSFPVSDLWEGVIKEEIGENLNIRVQNFLSAYLAISFGIGYRCMKDGTTDLTIYFDSIRKPLIASFVCSVREYSPMLCSINKDIGNMSRIITEVGALLATAAQYEFTHQVSWIPGFFDFRQEDIMAAFVSYSRIEVATSVLSESVIELVRVSGLLSDQARPRKNSRRGSK